MKNIYMTIAALFAAATATVQAQNTANGHEYVDLGLPSGTLWATCNVGATNPGDRGDYFSWGETEKKYNYDWSTYKWCDGSNTTLTKYNNKSEYGTVDNMEFLAPEDDAAHVIWGGAWRMPTYDEVRELVSKCTSTFTSQDGRYGRRFTSTINGNSIFIPAAGYVNGTVLYKDRERGYYWSQKMYTTTPSDAFVLYFSDDYVGASTDHRAYGCPVRPVMGSAAFTIVPIVEGTGLMDIPSAHIAALEALTYVGEMTLQAVDGQPHFSKGGKDLFFFNSEWKLQIADGVSSADNITHELTQEEHDMIVSKFTAAQYAADQIAAAEYWFTIGVSFPDATGIRSIDNNEASPGGGLEGAATYNLSGQRVGNDYKGIVIINGKKHVVK